MQELKYCALQMSEGGIIDGLMDWGIIFCNGGTVYVWCHEERAEPKGNPLDLLESYGLTFTYGHGTWIMQKETDPR